MTVQLLDQPKKHLKRYTPQKKYDIIKEAEEIGNFRLIAEKYGIHQNTLTNWRKQIENGPEQFLSRRVVKRKSREISILEHEVEVLKNVIVSQSKQIELLSKKV